MGMWQFGVDLFEFDSPVVSKPKHTQHHIEEEDRRGSLHQSFAKRKEGKKADSRQLRRGISHHDSFLRNAISHIQLPVGVTSEKSANNDNNTGETTTTTTSTSTSVNNNNNNTPTGRTRASSVSARPSNSSILNNILSNTNNNNNNTVNNNPNTTNKTNVAKPPQSLPQFKSSPTISASPPASLSNSNNTPITQSLNAVVADKFTSSDMPFLIDLLSSIRAHVPPPSSILLILFVIIYFFYFVLILKY